MLTEEQLNKVKEWGKYNLPPQKMAVLLKLSPDERDMFELCWEDPNHEIRLMWEEGRVKAEMDVMESLELFSKKDMEGSGEAAKALGVIKWRQRKDQLKSDLFGL